jgi:hypothetical protein
MNYDTFHATLKEKMTAQNQAIAEREEAEAKVLELRQQNPDLDAAMKTLETCQENARKAKQEYADTKNAAKEAIKVQATSITFNPDELKNTVFGVRRSVEPVYGDDYETIKGLADAGQYHLLKVNKELAKKHVRAYAVQEETQGKYYIPFLVFDTVPGIGVEEAVTVTVSDPKVGWL